MTTPVITVAICTRNRARHLRAALDSVMGQTLDADAFEVLVVDNGSQDETPAVVRSFGARVRGLHEPTAGLSRARNTALAHAASALVAYLDDDAVADPGWLAALCARFESDASIGVVGGRTLPAFESPPPSWLHPDLLLCLSVVDWCAEPCELRAPRFLVGANMAFRAAPVRVAGGFRTDLGRVGGNLLSGEEQDLIDRLEAAGHRTWYEPAATVHHYIPTERMTQRWLLARARGQGAADAVRGSPGDLGGAGAALRTVAAALVHPDPRQRFFARFRLALHAEYRQTRWRIVSGRNGVVAPND
jgi:glycosyltransferase involved in cell wall biosynthesis